MAVDITTLKIEVESNEARTAKRDLDRLTTAGEKSEASMSRLLASTAALTGALAAAGAIYRAATQRNKEFAASVSELSAITGATGEDLAFLTEQSRRFGLTTTLSATEAVKAFQLVASAKPDLLGNAQALTDTTEAAIKLAEATGQSLPQAADTLGSALNQFSAGAEEAERFINVLAAGSQKGAAMVHEVADALRFAGVIAADAGVSFEQTNGAIQLLSQFAIKGGEAGTALRNVILTLNTNIDENLRPSVVGLSAALENLAAKQLDETEMLELFDRRSLTVAKTLVNNRGKLDDLTAAITNTNIAHEQASVRVDNLDGDLKRLNSAWESLLITVGEGFVPAQREATGAITNALVAVDDYIAATERGGAAARVWAFSIATLSKIAFRAAVEFADLGDIIGSAMAQIGRLVALDFEGAAAVRNARAETRAALDERIERYSDIVDFGAGILELEREITAEQNKRNNLGSGRSPAGPDEPSSQDSDEIAGRESVAEAIGNINDDILAGIEARYAGERELITRQADDHIAALTELTDLTVEEEERRADLIVAIRQAEQEQLDAINDRVFERLTQRYATERELAEIKAEEDMEALMALTDLTAEEEERRAQLIEDIRLGLADNLVRIEERRIQREGTMLEKAALERARFEQMSWQQRTQIALGELSRMTSGVAQHNRTLFEMNKIAAMAEAAVALPQAVMKTWARWGYPMGIPMVAAQVGAGLAQISAISSASFSGGGAGTTPSAAGSVPTINNQPVTPAGQVLDETEQRRVGDSGRVLRVEISANGFLTPDMVDQVAAGIREAVAERDVVLFDADSRQAQDIQD